MLRGGSKSKANCTSLHRNLATWQSIKRCWIVLSLEQKQHYLLPFQFRLAKLSFVKITPLFKYHINILIFKGIFSFHKCLSNCTLPLLISALYIELTVNIPNWFKFHRKTSALSFKWTFLTCFYMHENAHVRVTKIHAPTEQSRYLSHCICIPGWVILSCNRIALPSHQSRGILSRTRN